ncbi:hypothetical protein TorRG33x02_343110, partial [Trema orientale]
KLFNTSTNNLKATISLRLKCLNSKSSSMIKSPMISTPFSLLSPPKGPTSQLVYQGLSMAGCSPTPLFTLSILHMHSTGSQAARRVA